MVVLDKDSNPRRELTIDVECQVEGRGWEGFDRKWEEEEERVDGRRATLTGGGLGGRERREEAGNKNNAYRTVLYGAEGVALACRGTHGVVGTVK